MSLERLKDGGNLQRALKWCGGQRRGYSLVVDCMYVLISVILNSKG